MQREEETQEDYEYQYKGRRLLRDDYERQRMRTMRDQLRIKTKAKNTMLLLERRRVKNGEGSRSGIHGR